MTNETPRAHMREREDYCGGRDRCGHLCKRYPFCATHAGSLTPAREDAYLAEYNATCGKDDA